MRKRFFGGSHPAGHKETTRRKPSAPPDTPPERVFLPLEGRECLVQKGEQVTVGQPVARPAREADVTLHASVSGKVEQVSEQQLVLRSDGEDTPFRRRRWSGEALPSVRELAQFLREAGVVGMAAGDGGPIHRKLVAAAAAPVDTLIVNGTECDPWHTADHRLMVEQGEKVVAGARLLAGVLKVSCAVLAVAGDKMDAVTALEDLTGGDGTLKVRVLRSRYPIGEERILTLALTGRRVPPGGSPLGVGCVVFNVATAAAIADAFYEGLPLTHRIITLTGSAVRKPRNLWVPIGTPVEALVDSVDGLKPGTVRGYWGNPMRFPLLTDSDAPVGKDTAAVVLMRSQDVPRRQEGSTCIRCGACVEACPMKLLPLYAGMGEEGERDDCVNCGACSYVCPAALPLRERMMRREGDTQ